MNNKKLKGFTLIELIVVIAIIVILSGISSLAIAGFRRDARIESNQKLAQMVFTGFQNILIQSEIKQNASWLNCDPKTPTSGHEDSEIKYVQVNFHVAEGPGSGSLYTRKDLGAVQVTNYYATGGTSSTSYPMGGDDYNTAKTAIMGNIDSSFEGTVVVFINYEDYTVDSVVYRELDGGRDPQSGVQYTKLAKISELSNGAYECYGAYDYRKIRDVIKSDGIYYGVYPYQSSVL